MSSIDPLADVERVASEGLDHVFAHGSSDTTSLDEEQPEEEPGDTSKEGLTLAQTAALLGFDQRSVKRLIKERKICGRRQGQDRQWVVDLECVQTWLQKLGTGQDSGQAGSSAADNESHQLAIASQLDENLSSKTLWHKLDMAGQQLRAATFRIGYLEAQVDLYRQQAALLPGYQADAARANTAEQEAGNLQKQLAEAKLEIEMLRRPWWQRWFSCGAQEPETK